MALGIDYRHYKDIENTKHWKEAMIKMINEVFPIILLIKWKLLILWMNVKRI